MKKHVIAYLHTHWDREWYREYEIFRMRLLRVFDNVLNLLDTNRIPCFFFDGQVSALEDYLEIRPEKEALVRELIRQKKLFVGPFFCLIDEFLTDRTCFSKNLEIGMKKSIELGCTDFIGYLPDTFGHSKNVVEILNEFGIDKCVVWRGCGDFPSEFRWCGADTVNLVRGYFNDVFSLDCEIEKKAEILKDNLDKIAEKSGEYILLPIGADHLDVEEDICEQINSINEILEESYEIKLSSPFEYFNRVQDNFGQFEFDDELRDCSKTFILQGCYSSRLDLKRYNTECCHKLDLADRFVRFTQTEEKYGKLIEYAYKMLLRNQAHDSICGCSTDLVHEENIIRYKKILQIAETVVDELKYENNFDDTRILNLDNRHFSGMVEINSAKHLEGFEDFKFSKGFDKNLLTNTHKIPVTEDYTQIHTYLTPVNDIDPDNIQFVMPALEPLDLEITDKSLKNSHISLQIKNNTVFINNIPFLLTDYADLGDSYNNGPKEDDSGSDFIVVRSKILYSGKYRAILRIDFEGARDIVTLNAVLDKNSAYIKFEFNWTNTQKNHLLEAKFSFPSLIKEVYSEDMNVMIKRKFDSKYDIRKNLPQQRGLEARTNTAPMQRGLLIDEKKNNIGIITKGLTQYEILGKELLIPILRCTASISNPKNPARTTPAGPPIETPALQMQGFNKAEMYVFFGNLSEFENVLHQVYNYIII